MNQSNPINTAFDFRTDTPPGKDPDTWSPTLCTYHKLLWSKPLPDGTMFTLLHKPNPPFYLHHDSERGRFCLSSDTVIPTFRKQKSLSDVFARIPDEMRNFGGLGYTIGGMMVFPAIQVDRQRTINQARGFNARIKDRFDHTLECIRRHYASEESPLSDVLTRYADFFQLFGDFRGYVAFFHLQDLLTPDASAVEFFSPFNDFKTSPVPDSVEAYLAYRKNAVNFLKARNQRIQNWAEIHLNPDA
ncbi:MAG: hypothetical protein JJU29_13155 [Verrucomicrobia bacterium]|nr:hypothetical protein [Verrucomicrobiota bacterium]